MPCDLSLRGVCVSRVVFIINQCNGVRFQASSISRVTNLARPACSEQTNPTCFAPVPIHLCLANVQDGVN